MTPHRIITALLAIAVVVLFILHFNNPSAEGEAEKENASVSAPAIPISSNIVYVNSDSLLENYVFYKAKKAEFESKENQIKNHLQAESERLQKDAADYQELAATMSGGERAKREEELMVRQQNLMKKKDDMLEAFDEEQSKFNEELFAKLSAHLKAYNKEKNYTFILGYQKGGGILFANDSLDITRDVLDGLNKDYQPK